MGGIGITIPVSIGIIKGKVIHINRAYDIGIISTGGIGITRAEGISVT